MTRARVPVNSHDARCQLFSAVLRCRRQGASAQPSLSYRFHSAPRFLSGLHGAHLIHSRAQDALNWFLRTRMRLVVWADIRGGGFVGGDVKEGPGGITCVGCKGSNPRITPPVRCKVPRQRPKNMRHLCAIAQRHTQGSALRKDGTGCRQALRA